MEWISVKECSPSVNESVLACVKKRSGKEEKVCVEIVSFRICDEKADYCYSYDPGDGWMKFRPYKQRGDIVTHWMPLPEPPKF